MSDDVEETVIVDDVEDTGRVVIEGAEGFERTTVEDLLKPVEDDKPDTDVNEESEDPSNDDADEESKAVKKGGKGIQKRINKLTKKIGEASAEGQAQRLRADNAEAELVKLKKGEAPNTVTKPAESDYEDYGDYLDAEEAYEEELEKGATTGDKPADKVDKKLDKGQVAPLSESEHVALNVVKQFVNEAENLPDDFKEVTGNKDLQINGSMLEALAECDNPTDVLYSLGKDAKLSMEISVKSPAKIFKQIAQLDRKATLKNTKPPKKITKAPAPISKVGGSDGGVKDVSDMTFKEREAHLKGSTSNYNY